MVLFVSISDDLAAEKLANVKMTNSPQELASMNQSLSAGNQAICNWAVQNNGQVLQNSGEMVVSIQASALPTLKEAKRSYENLTGNRVSIGIGTSTLDAAKAMEVARIRGGDRVIFYTEECDLVLNERGKLNKSVDLALKKDEPPIAPDGNLGPNKKQKKLDANTINAPIPNIAEGQQNTPAPLEIEKIMGKLGNEGASPKAPAFHGKLAGLATENTPVAPAQSPHHSVKQTLGQALQLLHAQSPAIEELKVLNPQLYQGINELALTVVELTRLVANDTIQKSENSSNPVQKIASIVGKDLANHDCKSGACYHATEAMYHLMGGKEAGYQPHVVDGHWSLKNQHSGKEYFGNGSTISKPKKFATEQPSSKAVALIDEVIRNGPVNKSDNDLLPYYMPKPKKPPARQYLKLPFGSVNNGRMKIMRRNGEPGYKTLLSGMVQSKTDAPPIMGPNSHPASPKEPYSNKE